MDPLDVIRYVDRNLTNFDNFPPIYSETRSITVQVLAKELWDKFDKRTTEMIVTKAGRRMFPVIKLAINGLEPKSFYKIILEFVQIGDHRWKYVNNEWVQGSKSENKPAPQNSLYLHPESPNYGAHWMLKPVEFPKVKLTNKQPPEEGQVVLNSLHKYEPKVHIIKCNPGHSPESFCVRLSKTQFMAVTAYQNDEVTELKVHHNPHAKAHQENKAKKMKLDETGSITSTPPPLSSMTTYSSLHSMSSIATLPSMLGNHHSPYSQSDQNGKQFNHHHHHHHSHHQQFSGYPSTIKTSSMNFSGSDTVHGTYFNPVTNNSQIQGNFYAPYDCSSYTSKPMYPAHTKQANYC